MAAWLVSGCQGFARPTPQPSPTPILLAPIVTPTAVIRSGDTATAAPAPGSMTPGSGAVSATPTSSVRSGSLAPTPTATGSPAAILGLGTRPQVTLRSLPQAGAPAVAQVPGSHTLWAEGRTADGEWLRVRDEAAGLRGWVYRGDLQLFGDPMLLAIMAPESALSSVARSPEAPNRQVAGRVSSGPLNVRSGPGTDQAIVGQLNAGDGVTVIGRSAAGDWLAIQWQGTGTAWVAARFVATEAPTDALPVLAGQTTAGPNPGRPLSGKVAFQVQTGGDIYLVNADGSGLRRLTDGLDPALSPDGTRLAFARWAAPQGIFVLDLRTGREERVATANRPRSPTWSPDGRQIAFSHLTRSFTCRQSPFGCLNDDQLRALFGGQDCTQSPRGRICIGDFPLTQAEETRLAEVTLGDGSWRDLPSAPSSQSPTWHPDRPEILYRSKDGLELTELSGTTRLLAKNPDMGSPAWSPDGQSIVVQIYLHDHTDLFLLDAGGNVRARLTAPASTIGRAPNNVAPVWSPDGRHILYLSDRDGGWRLYRMNADGSDQAPFLAEGLAGLAFRYDFAAERVVSWGP